MYDQTYAIKYDSIKYGTGPTFTCSVGGSLISMIECTIPAAINTIFIKSATYFIDILNKAILLQNTEALFASSMMIWMAIKSGYQCIAYILKTCEENLLSLLIYIHGY